MIARLVRARIALGWVIALTALYLSAPSPRSLGVGLPLALGGLVIRGLAAGTIRKGTELATTGPYALTRNPLYLGSSLLAAGFGIMSGSLLAAAVLVVPSAVVYPLVIRNEERHLQRRYGPEFDEFRQRVPCFLPHRLSRRAIETVTFGQFMANGEYNASLGFLAATLVLLVKFRLSGG
jgi:protein-S-isoprenylcysteine O-methyltransferase Ste14